MRSGSLYWVCLGMIVGRFGAMTMTTMTEESNAGSFGELALFPLTSQARRVREAAAQLLKRRTTAAANRYRQELAGGIFNELAALGFSEEQQDEAVGAFLTEVERELAEIHYQRIRLLV